MNRSKFLKEMYEWPIEMSYDSTRHYWLFIGKLKQKYIEKLPKIPQEVLGNLTVEQLQYIKNMLKNPKQYMKDLEKLIWIKS